METNSGSGIEQKTGSRMNIPDHISESLETIFVLKILKLFDADPGYGSATLSHMPQNLFNS
jgi:hypothetical protein